MSRGSVNEHHCRRVAGGPFDLRGTLAGPNALPLSPLSSHSPQDPRSKDLAVLRPPLSLSLSLFGPRFPLVSSLKINTRTRTYARLFPPRSFCRSFLLLLPVFVSLLAFFFARADYFYLRDLVSLSFFLSRSILSFLLHPLVPSFDPPPSFSATRLTVPTFKTSEHLYR